MVHCRSEPVGVEGDDSLVHLVIVLRLVLSLDDPGSLPIGYDGLTSRSVQCSGVNLSL